MNGLDILVTIRIPRNWRKLKAVATTRRREMLGSGITVRHFKDQRMGIRNCSVFFRRRKGRENCFLHTNEGFLTIVISENATKLLFL